MTMTRSMRRGLAAAVAGALLLAATAVPAAAVNEEARLIAPDADASDLFGSSVSVSGDTAVVGSPGNDSDSVPANAHADDDPVAVADTLASVNEFNGGADGACQSVELPLNPVEHLVNDVLDLVVVNLRDVGATGRYFTASDCAAASEVSASGTTFPVALPAGQTHVYFTPPLDAASYATGEPTGGLAGATVDYSTNTAGLESETRTVDIAVLSTDNDVPQPFLESAPCVEDTECAVTLGATDPDPEDKHVFRLASAVSSAVVVRDGPGGNVLAPGDEIPSGVAYFSLTLENAYDDEFETTSYFAVDVEDVPPPSTGFASRTFSDFSVGFNVRAVDDAPVLTGDVDHTGDSRVDLVDVVFEVDDDRLELIFLTVPDAATEGELTVVATGAPVEVGVGVPCADSTCSGDVTFTKAESQSETFNTLLGTADFVVHDRAPNPDVDYGDDGFGGLSSESRTISFYAGPSETPRIDPASSRVVSFAEGDAEASATLAVRVLQKDGLDTSEPAPQLLLALTALPAVAAANNSPEHTEGVVFVDTEHRNDQGGDTEFGDVWQDVLFTCSPSDNPCIQYDPVAPCDHTSCDFEVVVRACNATEAAEGCDVDFAGLGGFQLTMVTPGNDYYDAAFDADVANDHADAGFVLPYDCQAAAPTEEELQPGGLVHPETSWCTTDVGNDPPTFDVFSLDAVNDHLEGVATWELTVEAWVHRTDLCPSPFGGEQRCSGYINHCTDELCSAGFEAGNTLAVDLINASGVTSVPLGPGGDYNHGFTIANADLLELRRALYWGVRFTSTIPSTTEPPYSIFGPPPVVEVTLTAKDAGGADITTSTSYFQVKQRTPDAEQPTGPVNWPTAD